MKTLFSLIFWSIFFLGCTTSDSHKIEDSSSFEGLNFCRVDSYVFQNTPLDASCLTSADLVFEKVLQLGKSESSDFGQYFGLFKDNPDWKTVQGEIENILGDLEKEKSEIQSFFAKYQTLFPEEEMPQVVFYNGGFNYGVYPDKRFLGIGLEWFLGSKSNVYLRLAPENFPKYRMNQMIPERLVPQSVFGYLNYHHFEPIGGRFVDFAIAHGKMVYLACLMLESNSPQLLFGYTKAKWDWAEANEYGVWKKLVKEEVLYSRDVEINRVFFTDGPFTNGLPAQSAPNLGMYMGYKMVQDYMVENEGVSPQQLLKIEAKDIIKYYNPK